MLQWKRPHFIVYVDHLPAGKLSQGKLPASALPCNGQETAWKWLRMTLRVKGPGKVQHLSRRIYEKNVPLRIPTPSPTASLPPEVKFLNEIGKVQIRGVALVKSLTLKA